MTEAQSDPEATSTDVSDEDLAAKQARVEELRRAVAQAQSDLAGRQAAVQRQIDMAQLNAEQARLEVMLTQAKKAAAPETVDASGAGPLAQAKAQLEAAQQSAAQVGPVDTNANVPEEQQQANALPTAESVAEANQQADDEAQANVDELVNQPVPANDTPPTGEGDGSQPAPDAVDSSGDTGRHAAGSNEALGTDQTSGTDTGSDTTSSNGA